MADLTDYYHQIPVVTRSYLTISFLTTAACHLEIISPHALYFNFKRIVDHLEFWRLFTNFFFFGVFNLDFVFHMFFLVRYSKSLEEGVFRGRTADFAWMLILGAVCLTCFAPFIYILFLGSSLSFMMVYVWGRRNENVRMSFLGLFTFTAPYLPWVLLMFSILLGNSPVIDLLGIVVGHTYYFFDEVYYRMRGKKLLQTPKLLHYLFGTADSD
mmetsp:Transcript_4468/g.6920  ORF Transcript_4468/g.6920 Transcript_4468/m.6920 type:complete len:213 (-) Transcript_4468:417-1055(-)